MNNKSNVSLRMEEKKRECKKSYSFLLFLSSSSSSSQLWGKNQRFICERCLSQCASDTIEREDGYTLLTEWRKNASHRMQWRWDISRLEVDDIERSYRQFILSIDSFNLLFPSLCVDISLYICVCCLASWPSYLTWRLKEKQFYLLMASKFSSFCICDERNSLWPLSSIHPNGHMNHGYCDCHWFNYSFGNIISSLAFTS